MIIKIGNKDYEIKAGNKAILNLNKALTSQEGTLGFKNIVDAYWDSIRVKGDITYEEVEDYVDLEPTAMSLIMAELEAFKALQEVAKK